ncbi:hypothetical protein MASR2M15_08590 [Anaerolineales bacterium]
MTSILIIEDESQILEALSYVLEKAGYQVLTAQGGIEGLQKAQQSIPDLILCDIMMPGISGYEVLKELQNRSTTATIPFIFLTALADKRDLRHGMSLGADDYLTKPFKNQDVIKAVQARLARQKLNEKIHLKEFANHIISIQEKNRQEVAQALDMEVEAALLGLRMTLSISKDLSDPFLRQQFEQLLEQVIEDVQELSARLHPRMLEYLGLLAALLWLCERYRQQYGLDIHCQHQGMNQVFPADIKLGIFRLIEDMLSFVHKIAAEQAVYLFIKQQDQAFSVQCEVQNIGMPLNDEMYSLELTTLHQRADQLGGSLLNSSEHQNAFSIFLTIEQTHAEKIPYQPNTRFLDNLKTRVKQPSGRLNQRLRLWLADRNSLIRDSLIQHLASYHPVEMVGTCAPEHILDRLSAHEIDVLLMNPIIHGYSIYEVLRPIREAHPNLPILVVSHYSDDAIIAELFQNGANAFIHYEQPTEMLMKAIYSIAEGGNYLGEAISEARINPYIAHQNLTEEQEIYERLTPREKEIFQLVAEGETNASIANELVISVRTVEAHRANLMRKLDATSSNDLFRIAVKIGIISA